jgi:hypothetical protein
MNRNGRIKIVPSLQLNEMKLSRLAGREGTVIENLSSKERKNKGYMVELDSPFKQESVWFVPLESIENGK